MGQQLAIQTPAALAPIQLTIEDAMRAGEVGMAQVAGSANRACPGWTDMAYDFVIRFIQDKECFWPWELINASLADERFTQPPDLRSWGSIYTRVANDGYMRLYKEGPTRRHPRRHGVPVYGWLVLGNVSNETVNAATVIDGAAESPPATTVANEPPPAAPVMTSVAAKAETPETRTTTQLLNEFFLAVEAPAKSKAA